MKISDPRFRYHDAQDSLRLQALFRALKEEDDVFKVFEKKGSRDIFRQALYNHLQGKLKPRSEETLVKILSVLKEERLTPTVLSDEMIPEVLQRGSIAMTDHSKNKIAFNPNYEQYAPLTVPHELRHIEQTPWYGYNGEGELFSKVPAASEIVLPVSSPGHPAFPSSEYKIWTHMGGEDPASHYVVESKIPKKLPEYAYENWPNLGKAARTKELDAMLFEAAALKKAGVKHPWEEREEMFARLNPRAQEEYLRILSLLGALGIGGAATMKGKNEQV